MKILLDTHTFLWYISADKQLSAGYVEQLRSRENTVYLSVVSLWEAIIKYELGKLPLPRPPHLYLPEQRRRHQILNLDVNESSVLALATLPSLHRDPFDRLLICQAISQDMVLATVDKEISQYPIRTLTDS